MKISDYFYHHEKGAFDMRTVVKWHREGKAYYTDYHIQLNTGSTVVLKPDEFITFKTRFEKIEI